jgi:hypothetical protein
MTTKKTLRLTIPVSIFGSKPQDAVIIRSKKGIFAVRFLFFIKTYTDHTMNLRFVFCLLLISSFAAVQGKSQNKSFDRATFYKILKSGKAERNRRPDKYCKRIFNN